MAKITLFGGTGGCGSAFLTHALEAKHSVVLQARTPSKVTVTHENLTVVQGDGTSAEDVMAVCAGSDVVVSCAGSSRIMESLARNIVAACKAHKIERCYFITSLGMGGSSPTVRFVLGCIVGWGNIHDCEAADKIILDAGFTAVRPTELTVKGEPAEKYCATAETGMSMGALHKSDVGLFICDEISSNEWCKKPVQLYKAK
mmetsp:Transcript_10890/g.23081  ORF Transcript_10890/g.23081 Transcript_10890/m.23081 type:complete len:201 (-) Transcript_10890:113-715(-)|eukprot:CAMPEP_0201124318 /NCGR_PEP_ID=MMETSP0850-20130426/10682_1 /ASSEMBLY_ACC=CAM_ASM_000622 /TAXON_ID=183588 /ORGANISM="Pseudo-nitzschia fraudulenta, Strain WWA7" /LENGTH=200 /DNA_ID=CAMNT_0047391537 /DNA_START=129 /DNA_END=731 /DNA_ORIENTATION=-